MDETKPKSVPGSRTSQSLSRVTPEPTLTLDTLAPLIVHQKASKPLRVRGKARNLRYWEGSSVSYCYGDLTGDNRSIGFRVPLASRPYDGEDIIIAGALTVDAEFEVQLHGDIEGRWQPLHRDIPEILPERTRSNLTLAKFLEHQPVSAIGFLVSKTSWGDICGAANLPELDACQHLVAHFGDEGQFIDTLASLLKHKVSAIVVARGGGDKIGAISNSTRVAKKLLESGLPYYTALGHHHDLHLLDKYSDESFIAPSDLAHRIRTVMEEHRANKAIREENAVSRLQIQGLSNQLSQEHIARKEAQAENEILIEKSRASGVEKKALADELGRTRKQVRISLAVGAALFFFCLWQMFHGR